MAGNRVKLLLASVGTLVGQNILGVLNYPGFSRRALAEVVGISSVADTAANFLCDRCYLVPPTASVEYRARMRDILLQESPDLILCCRDEDTYALSQLKNKHPEMPGALPVGPPHAALIGLDKWQTWLFTRRHGLPFAESFLQGESGNGAALAEFCRRVGYPLVAKPVRGTASRGVCFIRNAVDAEAVAQQSSYLFQEYIGDPQNLEPYFAALQGPPPLFAQYQDANYHVAHTIIAPTGGFSPIVLSENQTAFGHTYRSRYFEEPALDTITTQYARALFSEGGTGPMNVQFRQNPNGDWKGLEINLRTSGMLARFLVGSDELSFLVNAFVPGASFPQLHPKDSDQCCLVTKQYESYQILDKQVAVLQRLGIWSRS